METTTLPHTDTLKEAPTTHPVHSLVRRRWSARAFGDAPITDAELATLLEAASWAPSAGYDQTLAVLAHAKHYRPDVLTKTSLMLGLGETEAEIMEAMDDLRAADVDILTLGQYLQPTAHHYPIARWVSPDEFETYRQWGLDRGFLEVVSGVFVRSSYRAEQVLQKNNVGLG